MKTIRVSIICRKTHKRTARTHASRANSLQYLENSNWENGIIGAQVSIHTYRDIDKYRWKQQQKSLFHWNILYNNNSSIITSSSEIRFYTFDIIFTENKHEKFSIEEEICHFPLFHLQCRFFLDFRLTAIHAQHSILFFCFASSLSHVFCSLFFFYSPSLYIFIIICFEQFFSPLILRGTFYYFFSRTLCVYSLVQIFEIEY